MAAGGGSATALLLALATAGCSKEARTLGPSQPQTAPEGAADPRVEFYQSNVYQISQGGRYFAWYGCSGCHAEGATGAANLPDGRWAHGDRFDEVYASIANGHGRFAYGKRVPAEQLWQLTAYVRDLPRQPREKRDRLSADQSAEPQGAVWTGPIK